MGNIRTYKADKLYTTLYGRKAYEVYMAREAEIDKMMKDPHMERSELCHLREQNFRRMKEEGEKFQAEQALKEKHAKDTAHPLAA